MVNLWDRWRRICKWIVISIAIAFAVFLGVAWSVGGSLVESANRRVGPPPNDLPIEVTTLTSQSGTNLATWCLSARDSKATVILVHSIRSDRRSMLGRARWLYESGYDVVMIDLQAHGESPGENITMGYLEKYDVIATIEFVRRSKPDHRIAVIGCSLGGAATVLASPTEIDGLILEAVYPRITQAVHDRVAIRLGVLHNLVSPVLIWQLQIRLGIPPEELCPIDRVSEIGCPLLFATGELDRHTPLAEAVEFLEAANAPKELVVFPGAGHVDLFSFDQEEYQRVIQPFLERCLNPGIGRGTAQVEE